MYKNFSWLDRFEHFETSFKLLESVINIEDQEQDEDYITALVPFYETTFELSWKFLKEYLAFKNISTLGPKFVIEKCVELHILYDKTDWLNMLEHRDMGKDIRAGHLNHSEVFPIIEKKYFPILKELYDLFMLRHMIEMEEEVI
jgi:nucleotidyltransferase substrate binding protein (TIGR01987 family)